MNKYKVIIKKNWSETEFAFSIADEATKFMAEVVAHYRKKDKDDEIEVVLKIEEPKELEEQEEETNEPISD